MKGETIHLDESLPSHLQPTSYNESLSNLDNFLIEESCKMYEDFAILNDPIALEQTLRSQYEKSRQFSNSVVS
jgi:hypothetical protein